MRTCTTHHHACDCREAAHAEEIEKLRRCNEEALRKIKGLEFENRELSAANREFVEKCFARGELLRRALPYLDTCPDLYRAGGGELAVEIKAQLSPNAQANLPGVKPRSG